MSSFAAQLLAPGGGMIMIPFIRGVIGCLLFTTAGAFAFGVARLHMGILSFLSIGLLLSISFFEKEYAKAMSMRKTDAVVSHTEGSKPNDKTD